MEVVADVAGEVGDLAFVELVFEGGHAVAAVAYLGEEAFVRVCEGAAVSEAGDAEGAELFAFAAGAVADGAVAFVEQARGGVGCGGRRAASGAGGGEEYEGREGE